MAIFRRFLLILLQLGPLPANFRPEKWPAGHNFFLKPAQIIGGAFAKNRMSLALSVQIIRALGRTNGQTNR